MVQSLRHLCVKLAERRRVVALESRYTQHLAISMLASGRYTCLSDGKWNSPSLESLMSGNACVQSTSFSYSGTSKPAPVQKMTESQGTVGKALSRCSVMSKMCSRPLLGHVETASL